MTDEPLQAPGYDRTPPDYVSRRRYRLLLAFAIVSVVLLVAGILIPAVQQCARPAGVRHDRHARRS